MAIDYDSYLESLYTSGDYEDEFCSECLKDFEAELICDDCGEACTPIQLNGDWVSDCCKSDYEKGELSKCCSSGRKTSQDLEEEAEDSHYDELCDLKRDGYFED